MIEDLEQLKQLVAKLQQEITELKQQTSVLWQKNAWVRALDEIVDDIGDQRAGRFISATAGSDPSDSDFSGMFMAGALQTIADGNTARLAEVLAGVAQFWVANGAAWAGGGAVKLDADGISVDTALTPLAQNKIKLVDGSEVLVESYAYKVGSAVQNYYKQNASPALHSLSVFRVYAPTGKTSEFYLETYVNDVITNYLRVLSSGIVEVGGILYPIGAVLGITGAASYARLNFISGDSTVAGILNREGTGGSSKHFYFGENSDTGKWIFRGSGNMEIRGKILRIETAKTPTSATDTGNAGEICWDANYIYVCVATNSWKRIGISAW